MVERERGSFIFSLHSKFPLFIEEVRFEEDPVRTGRIFNCYNPQSWPVGLPVLLLLRSLHPDIRFEQFKKIWPPFDVTLESL